MIKMTPFGFILTDSAVVIHEIMGSKEIFRNIFRFNPPPAPSNFRKMGVKWPILADFLHFHTGWSGA